MTDNQLAVLLRLIHARLHLALKEADSVLGDGVAREEESHYIGPPDGDLYINVARIHSANYEMRPTGLAVALRPLADVIAEIENSALFLENEEVRP